MTGQLPDGIAGACTGDIRPASQYLHPVHQHAQHDKPVKGRGEEALIHIRTFDSLAAWRDPAAGVFSLPAAGSAGIGEVP